ncbi:S8 family serine peptidase [Pseudonocardia sediminis]|uniref:S8 family serine peptidase n=1 Tax=Pseudonocardia sediminis TaxID=1397368 RepID=UPI0030FF0CD1
MTEPRGRALVVVAATALTAVVFAAPAAVAQPEPAGAEEYTVLLREGAGEAAGRDAVRAAGGTVVRSNPAVGALVVTAPAEGFAEAVGTRPGVLGATRARSIGAVAADPERPGRGRPAQAGPPPQRDTVEQEYRTRQGPGGLPPLQSVEPRLRPTDPGARLDPLDASRYGMAMVRAGAARAVEDGDRRVLVGVIDSGIDASHPDLAGQVDLGLSRNFARDIPTDPTGAPSDGPCEVASCLDPVDRDDNGHGTHVAGIVAAAANGIGSSGVAPGVRLVNLRGGQDSGLLFLQPVVDALTYGADAGVDVVNMSFAVDPWLFNCRANPADSPQAQAEQRTTIEAMQRALRYAHGKGVTLVGSLGNNHEDLGNPRTDVLSPSYPANSAYPRPIDNRSCLDLPVEGPHVIGVSAVGPSGTKSDYSNHGTEQISLAAPGGWLRDGFGTPSYQANENQILSTFPRAVLQAVGDVAADGTVTAQGAGFGVQRACDASGNCGYYAYLQGTSMAAPHVSGVAALVVSRFGKPTRGGGFGMNPAAVERTVLATAADKACPGPVQSYAREGRDAEYDAPCTGTARFNSLYGDGIVDAYAAVTARG